MPTPRLPLPVRRVGLPRTVRGYEVGPRNGPRAERAAVRLDITALIGAETEDRCLARRVSATSSQRRSSTRSTDGPQHFAIREDHIVMSRLLEVWGDTVDRRHLTASVALGIVLPVPVFLAARSLFGRAVDNPGLAGSYALLTGLAGCLLVGVIAAKLFPPKRIVTERASSEESRRAALQQITEEYGEIGDPATLDAPTQRELRQLGLYEVVQAHHVARSGPDGAGRAGQERAEAAR